MTTKRIFITVSVKTKSNDLLILFNKFIYSHPLNGNSQGSCQLLLIPIGFDSPFFQFKGLKTFDKVQKCQPLSGHYGLDDFPDIRQLLHGIDKAVLAS